MSILIRGMEMPHDCDECRLCAFIPVGDYAINRKCLPLNAKAEITIRRANCPLVPVPPHGRLIDADAFIAEQRHLYCDDCERRKGMKNGKMKFVYDIGDAPCRACGYGDVLDDIEDAPTIIPAEEGET